VLEDFDDSIFEELFWTKYGLAKQDMVKMNIKGVFQIWMRDGSLPRDQPQGVPRLDPRGLQPLPRLRGRARRHLHRRHRQDNDWTLTIVRTDLGREIISRMIADGSIEARPGDDDPGAIALMHKLAAKSRERWPEWAAPEARVGISTKKPAAVS
jgi:coenzyme F420 hydrogenase subunit beta